MTDVKTREIKLCAESEEIEVLQVENLKLKAENKELKKHLNQLIYWLSDSSVESLYQATGLAKELRKGKE